MATTQSTDSEITRLNEKIKKYEETIKKLHGINEINKNKYTEEINQLKENLSKKEQENNSLSDKIRSLERKNEDIYKNVTSGNISDLNEIKKQFDKDKTIMTELLKTYKNTIDEKTETISNLMKDINLIKSDLEEERKNNESLLAVNNAKYDSKSLEMQFYKISTENSSLRTKTINYEEKIDKLNETNEKLKSQQLDSEKLYMDSLSLLKKELEFKNNSYKTLLKDYQSTLQILTHSEEDLEKAKSFNLKYEKENLILERKIKSLENDLIDVKAENQGLLTRLKGNESEIEINRKKLKEIESKLTEHKLSKQVFEVTYIYLRMPLEGRITFQKEGDQYSVLIHNRTATRKYSFLDLDIFRNPNENNKIIVKFVKENNQEEYFCNDLQRFFEYYEEYKRKAIESSDFSSRNKVEKTNSEKKRVRVEKQLQDIFDI
jgi:hypothetical protein